MQNEKLKKMISKTNSNHIRKLFKLPDKLQTLEIFLNAQYVQKVQYNFLH